MKKINIGCGPDIKEGWTNTDIVLADNVQYWDITEVAPEDWHGVYDYALLNHTLCLLSYEQGITALRNIKTILKDGGILEIIDVDLLKLFEGYKLQDPEVFPGFVGSMEERLCKHIVGHGRGSIYTVQSLSDTLLRIGFNDPQDIKISEHDLRPKESLIVQAAK